MSWRFLFTCVLFKICLLGNSQNLNTLVYDYNTGEITVGVDKQREGRVQTVRYGSFAKIKVININTFRYKVEIEGKNFNYVTPIPSELQSLFRLNEELYSDKDIKEALAILERDNEIVQATANGVNFGDDESSEISQTLKKLVNDCEEYLKVSNEVADIKFTRMALINLSKQHWATHGDLLSELSGIKVHTSDQMRKTYKKFIELYGKVEASYGQLQKLAKTSKDTLGKGNDKRKSSLSNLETTMKSVEESVEEAHESIAEGDFLKIIDDVVLLSNSLENPKYFEVVSAPVQIDGDFVSYTITATPTPVNNLMPFEFQRKFPIEVPVKGGLKVDFAVGPVLSFGANSRDAKFYFDEVQGSDSVVLRMRDNNNVISPGLAASMHIYRRTGIKGALAGMFGVGAGFQSISDPNLSLYFGASWIFGKQQKVMISTGFSFLSLDRLKEKQYEVDKTYLGNDLNLNDVKEKIFQRSGFLGLFYNLTNRY